jgi:MOSC domain-containing protein
MVPVAPAAARIALESHDALHQIVGRVANLWRYPVKSMLGESMRELLVTERGAIGDRAWALRDLSSGRIASAKKYPQLLGFRASYQEEPTLDRPGRVVIQAPDGRTLRPEDPSASVYMSKALGRPMRFENKARADERTGIDPSTVFGDVPVNEMKSDWTPETMPDYFQLMTGSFLEIGPVFVLASGSVDHLRTLQGGSALIDQRRFRPNIYIDSGPGADRFFEDDWLGHALAIGADVVIDGFQPTLWCATSTLAQEELPRDLSILRTTAQNHKGCLGVYASIKTEGRLRVGDAVVLQS